MIEPEQIPQEAWQALRHALHEGTKSEAALLAAALNAWPKGQVLWTSLNCGPTAYLPLHDKERA